MGLYDVLPYFIFVVGLLSGIFILSKINKLRGDYVLIIDFLLLGAVNIYVGVVYLLFITGFINGLDELSLLIRPINLIQILLHIL